MGGQQFCSDSVLIDTTKMNRVLNFDPEKGTIEVESGIQWPELVQYLVTTQKGKENQWGIVQKQTGANRLSIGGALAANVHGRGLKFKPFIQDVESFTIIDADGNLRTCSRRENSELFRLAIGGYGLFGIIYSVALRLIRRHKIERVVELSDTDSLISAINSRIEQGFTYGDLQFSTDETSDTFLHKGVISCYRPVDPSTPFAKDQKQLLEEDWKKLLYLAHVDKGKAFQTYSDYYLSTNGQIYWSDTHQMSTYIDDYHRSIDQKVGANNRATEMITEIYVPREMLAGFIRKVREDFRKNNVNLIYGTIRMIERDEECFLAWARQSYACIIFNLHVVHTPDGIEHSATAFRRLIDFAIQRGGCYFLTYHRYATKRQVLGCYPQMPEFLRLKQKYDPEERFQSQWYRHYKKMFADEI